MWGNLWIIFNYKFAKSQFRTAIFFRNKIINLFQLTSFDRPAQTAPWWLLIFSLNSRNTWRRRRCFIANNFFYNLQFIFESKLYFSFYNEIAHITVEKTDDDENIKQKSYLSNCKANFVAAVVVVASQRISC